MVKIRLSPDERKKEIMQAAAKVILEKGFSNATMEEIIANTTLSKGGVYHYYNNFLEIFKDLMVSGIDYRNGIIRSHAKSDKDLKSKEFIAGEFVEKIIDDTIYAPLYVEFLVAKKKIPELNDIMIFLQENNREKFKKYCHEDFCWLNNDKYYQFMTDFINSLILGAEVLNARKNFTENKELLKEIAVLISPYMERSKDEDL